MLLQKYRDRNGRCIAILFKSIGVRGRFDSPEYVTGTNPPKIAPPAEHLLAVGGDSGKVWSLLMHPEDAFHTFSLGVRLLSTGENAQKRGRGYRTQLAMLRHQNPIARNRRVSLRKSRGIAQYGATKITPQK